MRMRWPGHVIVASLFVLVSLSAVSMAGDFAGQDLRGQTFTGMRLDGSDFTQANAEGARFDRATLRRTIWLRANLKTAILGGADLTEADLRGVTGPFIGDDIDFTGANLKDVDLAGFGCDGCEFGGADLRRTRNWGLITAANFRKADLRGADLSLMTTDDPGNLAGFIGAIYDDATRWPPWVDMGKLRARKAPLDEERGEPPPVDQPAASAPTGPAALGSYECILQGTLNADTDPDGHPDNVGGTAEGYPLMIGEPRPGLNFTLMEAGVYVDSAETRGSFTDSAGYLNFTGGILDGTTAMVVTEGGAQYVFFGAYRVQCNLSKG